MSKFELLCQLKAISSFAYDIHYTADGRNFYSNHIFSERLADVDVEDDYIETMYLGESQDAPSSTEINARVIDVTPEISEDTDTNFKRLREMIVSALMGIEQYNPKTRAEDDILGSIAHILQRHNGLLYRQLRYDIKENSNDEDIKEWITVRGNHIPVMKGQTKEEAVKGFIEKNKGSESKISKTTFEQKRIETLSATNVNYLALETKDDFDKEKSKIEQKLKETSSDDKKKKYQEDLKILESWEEDRKEQCEIYDQVNEGLKDISQGIYKDIEFTPLYPDIMRRKITKEIKALKDGGDINKLEKAEASLKKFDFIREKIEEYGKRWGDRVPEIGSIGRMSGKDKKRE